MKKIKKKLRLIARLDIKGNNLIKSINLEGLRVMGDPSKFAKDYYEQGIDELIFIDCVASLYRRNQLLDIISTAAKDIFVPLTVGGGVRTVEDAHALLRAGADKIAINTAAVENPTLISELVQRFGSQCVVLSVEAKFIGESDWEVYTHSGREKTGINVVEWVVKCQNLGIGEVLLTSIDREGTRKGFEQELIKAVSSEVSVPLVVSGGFGKLEDLTNAMESGADAIAIADALHYKKNTVDDIRLYALKQKYDLRVYEK